MAARFKKGDWLIRKWKDGDIDLCRYLHDDFFKYNEHEFMYEIVFRFHSNDEFDFSCSFNSDDCDDDERIEFNWRLATSEEIEKYKNIIFAADSDE